MKFSYTLVLIFGIFFSFLPSQKSSAQVNCEYMGFKKRENLAIFAKFPRYCGIGVILHDINGCIRVRNIIPGEPADKGGQLKVNDRIVAIAQGNSPFEDITNMNLGKVVKRIRGKRGTFVRLLVVPGNLTNSSKRKLISIVRDEVKAKRSPSRLSCKIS